MRTAEEIRSNEPDLGALTQLLKTDPETRDHILIYRLLIAENNVRALTNEVCGLNSEIRELRAIITGTQLNDAREAGIWGFLRAMTPYITLVIGWLASTHYGG